MPPGNSQKPPVHVPPKPDTPGNIPPADPMPQNSNLNLPPVPGGADHPGQGVTSVSTDAIRTFAANLLLLEDPIRTALTGMGNVDIHAGAFNQAFVLSRKIGGDGQLLASTRTVLTNALDALESIRAACFKLVAEYDTAEELNKADANKFGELILDAKTVISGMGKN
jgi:hypothetical protein